MFSATINESALIMKFALVFSWCHFVFSVSNIGALIPVGSCYIVDFCLDGYVIICNSFV